MFGKMGELGKIRNSDLVLRNHCLTIWEFAPDSLPGLERPGMFIPHSHSLGIASPHPFTI